MIFCGRWKGTGMDSRDGGQRSSTAGSTEQRQEVVITLGEYLERLATQEDHKPARMRRPVPTITELADVACSYQSTVARFVRLGNKKRLFDLTTPILNELRRRGFDAELSDIVVY
jgi:hypothetical protein